MSTSSYHAFWEVGGRRGIGVSKYSACFLHTYFGLLWIHSSPSTPTPHPHEHGPQQGSSAHFPPQLIPPFFSMISRYSPQLPPAVLHSDLLILSTISFLPSFNNGRSSLARARSLFLNKYSQASEDAEWGNRAPHNRAHRIPVSDHYRLLAASPRPLEPYLLCVG